MVTMRLKTPIAESDVRKLRVGDTLYVTGTLVLARDEGHMRLLEFHEEGKQPPIPLEGMVLYHCGPVVKKNGKVASTNPGQLYGVISITGPVHNVFIEDDFDMEFDINPAKYGGGIEVLVVDPDGYATVITNYPGLMGSVWNNDPWNDALISIDLDTAIGGPLPPNHILMVYVKFKTAMKHQIFPDPTVPYDFEFWNRPMIWINNMVPYDDDPIVVEEKILLSIK